MGDHVTAVDVHDVAGKRNRKFGMRIQKRVHAVDVKNGVRETMPHR